MNEFTLLPNGKTVYQQLFEMGIHLDLGCGQGVCGECKVRFVEGDFKYNQEVLACLYADEIVSCCAIPTGPLVILV
jgi:ferredoxin